VEKLSDLLRIAVLLLALLLFSKCPRALYKSIQHAASFLFLQKTNSPQGVNKRSLKDKLKKNPLLPSTFVITELLLFSLLSGWKCLKFSTRLQQHKSNIRKPIESNIQRQWFYSYSTDGKIQSSSSIRGT